MRFASLNVNGAAEPVVISQDGKNYCLLSHLIDGFHGDLVAYIAHDVHAGHKTPEPTQWTLQNDWARVRLPVIAVHQPRLLEGAADAQSFRGSASQAPPWFTRPRPGFPAPPARSLCRGGLALALPPFTRRRRGHLPVLRNKPIKRPRGLAFRDSGRGNLVSWVMPPPRPGARADRFPFACPRASPPTSGRRRRGGRRRPNMRHLGHADFPGEHVPYAGCGSESRPGYADPRPIFRKLGGVKPPTSLPPQVWVGGKKVDELVGASKDKLEELVKKYN